MSASEDGGAHASDVDSDVVHEGRVPVARQRSRSLSSGGSEAELLELLEVRARRVYTTLLLY